MYNVHTVYKFAQKKLLILAKPSASDLHVARG